METFKKTERLTGKKKIEFLVRKGNSFSIFPLRVLWKEQQSNIIPSVQVVISVPKKNFTKAVDRNTIKRRIREAYRKNKNTLYKHLELANKKIALMLIFSDKKKLEQKLIEEKVAEVLQKLIKIT